MGFLTELHKAYNMSLEAGKVDQHLAGQTVLLPLYHNNLRANGKNIIRIHLNKDGSLERSEFILPDEIIVFPVTEDSVARAGRNAPSHPLVDKMDYVVPSDDDKHINYMQAFTEWYDFLPQGKNKDYLKIIKDFISKKEMLPQILDKLFEGTTYSIDGLNVTYEERSDKKTATRKLDLSKVFLTYSVNLNFKFKLAT